MAKRKTRTARQEIEWTPPECRKCGSNMLKVKATQVIREMDQDLGDRMVKRRYVECACGERVWLRHVIIGPDYDRLKGGK